MKEDKRKQAFEKAVSQAVEYSFQGYTKEIQNAPNPEKALKKIIRELDKRMDSGGFESELVAFGKRVYSGFTDSLCNKILSTDEPYPWQIVWREKTPDGWTIRENKNFNLFVCDKLKEKLEKLLNQVAGNENQTGRPPYFDKEASVKWYNELMRLPEYQHNNGKPHKERIRKEIIKRHTEIIDGQEIKPSMRTIKRHT